MKTKYCHGCETEKSVEEFSKDRTKKDGLCNRCKACRAVYMHKYQANHKVEKAAYGRAHLPQNNARVKAYQLRYPIRHKARQAASYAIASGRLIRPGHCENPTCGTKCKPEAHHYLGYEKEHWLDVEFLCSECHKEADRKLI